MDKLIRPARGQVRGSSRPKRLGKVIFFSGAFVFFATYLLFFVRFVCKHSLKYTL